MKSKALLTRLVELALLGVLVFALVSVLRGIGTDSGETFPQPLPTVPTTPVPPQGAREPATPALESTSHYPPPGVSETPPPYPPPESVANDPTRTPLPSSTPTATPWSVSALPVIASYPTPGPFREMRILYSNRLLPGLRSIKVDGTDDFPFALLRDHPALQTLYLENFKPSLDGMKVLYYFWSSRNPELASIWLMNPDGSGLQALVGPGSSDNWYPNSPMWSPDGAQIAYLRESWTEGHLNFRELWVMDADGSNARLVVNDPKAIDASVHPFWARNGYIYLANTQNQLIAINPYDGNLYKLLDDVDPFALEFALAPDGQHAVGWGQVTAGKLQSASFSTLDVPGEFEGWSPDGFQMVYSNEQGLWLFNGLTGEVQVLLSGLLPRETRIHGFSPDGRYVAYQTDAGLFVIDVVISDTQPSLVVSDPLDEKGNRLINFITWIPIQR